MQKEIDAKYYDAVVSHDAKHSKKWVEVGRRDNVVILEKRNEQKKSAKKATKKRASKKRVDMPIVRESEQPIGEKL